MSIKPVEYVDYDGKDIIRVGCMKCNLTVATRQKIKDGEGKIVEERLVHMTHSKRYRTKLRDGSFADLIVCETCFPTITKNDLKQLDKTMHWGWQAAYEWKFNRSSNPADAQAYLKTKEAFKIKDNEAKLPLRLWKHLFRGKEIKTEEAK